MYLESLYPSGQYTQNMTIVLLVLLLVLRNEIPDGCIVNASRVVAILLVWWVHKSRMGEGSCPCVGFQLQLLGRQSGWQSARS